MRSVALLLIVLSNAVAFSVISMSSKEIYGVAKSGWTSPEWRWGYGVGTGHDCAMICRRQYRSRSSRVNLVDQLIQADNKDVSFEEVKLVLGLAWQNGRWDGSDGGPGGYGDVLATMAAASRYEIGTEESCSRLLVQDMQERFDLLKPTTEELDLMKSVVDEDDYDVARRRCAGLVLSAMGFVDVGL